MFEINTEYGEIRFSINVIKRIINDAIAASNGKVYLYNFRGKIVEAMTPLGDHSGISIEETEEGLDVTMYVVIKFGTSISREGNRIVKYVKENITKVMGQEPHQVKLIVTGVASKEIARRNIEFVE